MQVTFVVVRPVQLKLTWSASTRRPPTSNWCSFRVRRRMRASTRCCASTASRRATSSRRIRGRAGCSSAGPPMLAAELFARIVRCRAPARDHRRAGRARARARRRHPRADRACDPRADRRPDRCAVVAGTRGADGDTRARSSASTRRRCTSRRRWERPRSRCSVRRAKTNGDRGGAAARRRLRARTHADRADIDGCGGGKVSECLTTLGVDDVHAQFEALLAETGARGPAAPVALMRLAVIRQRYTPFGGAERFLENALQALLERNVAVDALHARVAAPCAAWDSSRASSIRSTSAACGATRASRAPYARRSRDDDAALVQSHERLACCDLFRAGDGVHAAWLDERLRHLTWLRGLGDPDQPASSLPAGGGAPAVRERAAARGHLQFADGEGRHPRAFRRARRTAARHLQRR